MVLFAHLIIFALKLRIINNKIVIDIIIIIVWAGTDGNQKCRIVAKHCSLTSRISGSFSGMDLHLDQPNVVSGYR